MLRFKVIATDCGRYQLAAFSTAIDALLFSDGIRGTYVVDSLDGRVVG
jgi:hypothetical protein